MHLVDADLLPVLDGYLVTRAEWNADSLEGIRAGFAAPLLPSGDHDGVEVGDGAATRVDGSELALRWYVPRGIASPPAMLWIHGGGMVSGSIGQEEPSVLELVEQAGVAVVSVEYRLAPEHRHPAQSEDCLLAWAWLRGHALDLGVDPKRLSVGGSSAGAGLAAALSIALRDQGLDPPTFQLLIYPMLDDRHVTPSSTSLDLVWNSQANLFGWTSFLGMTPGGADVPTAAVPARCPDLTGLPPAFVEVGELDIFRDEAIDYATRLMHAGVSTELHVVRGAFHAFDRIAPAAEVSKYAQAARLRAVVKALGATPAIGRSQS